MSVTVLCVEKIERGCVCGSRTGREKVAKGEDQKKEHGKKGGGEGQTKKKKEATPPSNFEVCERNYMTLWVVCDLVASLAQGLWRIALVIIRVDLGLQLLDLFALLFQFLVEAIALAQQLLLPRAEARLFALDLLREASAQQILFFLEFRILVRRRTG